MDEDFVPGGTGETYTSTMGMGGGGDGGYGSNSSGGSQSTSEPISVESRQSDWGLLQSQLLSMLAEQQYNWAMQQYAKGEGVTDQTIANFLELSGKGKGLADTLMNQYQDQFKPLMDKYIQDAGSYASEGRQAFEAGKAMSTVAQADQAAIDEMGRKLGGFGINVNSGRYMDSMLAARTADAAARAGAGTKAAQDTEDRGRAMEEKAIAMGQQLPGQAMNAVQTAYTGLTGAESAVLGLLNAGTKLTESAAPYFNAAVGANKLPPTGQMSQATSQQQSESRTPGPQGGASGGGGGGSKAAPKQAGGGAQPKQPQQGGGKGKGEGEGGGGGKGPGGAGGGAGAKAAAAGANYGAAYPVKQTAGEKRDEEDPETGTGAPTEGYTGAVPYFDETGTIMPQYSPELGLAGTEAGATFDNAPQVSNWAPPPADQGYNVGPSGTGAFEDTGIGANLPMGWNDPFGTGGAGGGFGGQDASETSGAMWGEGQYDPLQDWAGGNTDVPTMADYTSGTGYDPYGDIDYSQYASGEDTYGGGMGADYDPWDQFQDYGQDSYQGVDESGFEAQDMWDNQGVDESGFSGDWSDDAYNAGDYEDYSSYDEGVYGDTSGYGGEYSSGGYDDYSSYDSNDYYSGDAGSYGGGYDEYARGGRVRPRPPQRGVVPMRGRPRPTTGGPVPRSASPSRGKQTDDISARLNAGEYVIPRDVVAHKGTEFFTKMIQNSRKLRTGMAGAKPKPTMKPGLPPGGRPGFSSRPMQLPRR